MGNCCEDKSETEQILQKHFQDKQQDGIIEDLTRTQVENRLWDSQVKILKSPTHITSDDDQGWKV